ncbi:hypothetical protein HPB47_007616 [Ixodes persulcatus]|uniref:Uncharacterized protein n=1 Tax=Ixodes persulcatus TaxID=34615 RepID=A0AC60P7A1_IXOPE|nr:hypothetical protein HPB47_007616 [Ixodes persulcatus]
MTNFCDVVTESEGVASRPGPSSAKTDPGQPSPEGREVFLVGNAGKHPVDEGSRAVFPGESSQCSEVGTIPDEVLRTRGTGHHLGSSL